MRRARIVLPGFPHHIILRGNNRRRLFAYPLDYRAFLRFLAASTRRYPIALHHFCLMRNHVHLLATPDEAQALSVWVKRFAQPYACRWNQARHGSGKLFEERFRSFPITNEHYLRACVAYVELNPVRAGLVLAPAYYPWSSYHLHAGDGASSPLPPGAWTPTVLYREMGHSPEERAAEFVRWIHGEMGVPPALPASHERAAAAAEELSEDHAGRVERPGGERAT